MTPEEKRAAIARLDTFVDSLDHINHCIAYGEGQLCCLGPGHPVREKVLELLGFAPDATEVQP